MLTRQQKDLAENRWWVENEDNLLKKATENLSAEFTSLAE